MRAISNFVNTVISVIIFVVICYLVYLYGGKLLNDADSNRQQIDNLRETTSEFSACMVKKSWGELDPISQRQIKDTNSLKSLTEEELAKVRAYADECRNQ